MVLLKHIISEIEQFAPPAFQEDYDNTGLQTGDPNMEIRGILITLDVTEEVLEDAISKGENLIVSHHPVTLSGIKKLTGSTAAERILAKAIQQNIAIYSAHTSIDSVDNGVSGILSQRLGLSNLRVLAPRTGLLLKLVTFVPTQYAEKVRSALFDAGAGMIGNYDCCSYNLEGVGTFRAGEGTNPYVGEKGSIHFEKEVRIETIIPKHLKNRILKVLLETHPYEEVAYDLYPLANVWPKVGFGAIGDLQTPLSEEEALQQIKKVTGAQCIRHTELIGNPVKKIAVCGGSGSFLLKTAIQNGADIFVSSDFKYHQFQEADNKIVIADIGHYESEQLTKEVFFELLTKKFPNFAVRLTNVTTNPVKYY
ncbi:Nif3-like dinuclear metal center hexameric protein [Thermophagus sp. OGC60D27]|uniref:Nif3-like dinuclear metal center hexameric protein n=1 Tax=Thermophagus sp. OGC60D27 TaxID=3458415 RepID=UPI00403778D9